MNKDVSKVVEHINNTIALALVSKKQNVVEQEKIDQLMIDMGSAENESTFGANAILSQSVSGCLQIWSCAKWGAPSPSHC
jgi:enolase